MDDQPDSASFVRSGLEREGFEVAVANSGRLALQIQREHAADVLVTDIFMPEMDGMEVIDTIKIQCPNTRVIAISDEIRGMQDYLRIARYVGADATLAKPFTAAELVRVVRSLL